MAERTDVDAGNDAATGSAEAAAGMPRWVKLFLIVGVALVLLFLVVMLTGSGGDHGPGRHGLVLLSSR